MTKRCPNCNIALASSKGQFIDNVAFGRVVARGGDARPLSDEVYAERAKKRASR